MLIHKTMKIKPLSDHILIEPVKEEEKTKSGILLPETVEIKKLSKGKVLAVGIGKITDSGTRVPVSVKVGETVLFKEPWSEENKLKEGDKEYFLVEENDILAIII
ncbi:MAG: chaperonin GroES [Parcubacteria group bacterium Gr01-1014_30]|nr:MAG: chaperonin GroES [Parcubacteria group bacterium Gr01-1014_30]